MINESIHEALIDQSGSLIMSLKPLIANCVKDTTQNLVSTGRLYEPSQYNQGFPVYPEVPASRPAETSSGKSSGLPADLTLLRRGDGREITHIRSHTDGARTCNQITVAPQAVAVPQPATNQC